MQEDIENRTMTLVISGSKFTGRLLKAALTKYLAHRKEKKVQKVQKKQAKSRDKPEVQHYGRISKDELERQHGDMRELDIHDKSLRQFDRIARKYHVQYAVFGNDKGKFEVFFKAPREANMQKAFEAFTVTKLKKAQMCIRDSTIPYFTRADILQFYTDSRARSQKALTASKCSPGFHQQDYNRK